MSLYSASINSISSIYATGLIKSFNPKDNFITLGIITALNKDSPTELLKKRMRRILKIPIVCVITRFECDEEFINSYVDSGFILLKIIKWTDSRKMSGNVLVLKHNNVTKIKDYVLPDQILIRYEPSLYTDERLLYKDELPYHLLKELVLYFTELGDFVFDASTEIGHIPIACREHKRWFIACEHRDKFYKIAKWRLDRYNNLNWRC